MTSRECHIIDLLNDPTCALLMKRDGVRRHDVLMLLRTTKPLVGRSRISHYTCDGSRHNSSDGSRHRVTTDGLRCTSPKNHHPENHHHNDHDALN